MDCICIKYSTNSKQDILHIAFSKMIGSPLTSVHRLKDCISYMMWKDLKSELLRQYSKIPFDSHAIQVLAHIWQGHNELLEMYLHHASELLSKIHHTTNMIQILAEGLNYYTVVYCLNSTKLKDTKVPTGILWRTASVIYMFFLWAMKELRVIPGWIVMLQKHQ